MPHSAHLIQLLLPLADNQGKAFPASTYEGIREELTHRFGGLTAFTRSPAIGLWMNEAESIRRDDMVVFEVMTEKLEKKWWSDYRARLEKLFRQDVIVIRAQALSLL